jgi:hypothetical protein
MNAYKVILTLHHHVKNLLVIAETYGMAEDSALLAMKRRQQTDWVVQSIEKAAIETWDKESVTLVLPS